MREAKLQVTPTFPVEAVSVYKAPSDKPPLLHSDACARVRLLHVSQSAHTFCSSKCLGFP